LPGTASCRTSARSSTTPGADLLCNTRQEIKIANRFVHFISPSLSFFPRGGGCVRGARHSRSARERGAGQRVRGGPAP
jgi:hypothetical protein